MVEALSTKYAMLLRFCSEHLAWPLVGREETLQNAPQFGATERFTQDRSGTPFQRGKRAAHEDDRQVGMSELNLLQQTEAVHFGHLKVGHEQIKVAL